MTTDNTDREGLELLPCPFCGKTPETGITGAPECDNWRYVKCSDDYCAIRYSMFSVKAWNTRAAVAAPQRDALLSLKELTDATLLSLEKIDTAKLAALGRDRDAESVGNARRLLGRVLFELRGLND